MALYDDTEPTEKVRIYDSGYYVNSGLDNTALRVDYRMGDIYIPKLDTTEALRNMAKDFLDSIERKQIPIANSSIGLEAVSYTHLTLPTKRIV